MYSNLETISKKNFKKWLKSSKKYLNSAGETIYTSHGPIQYVWEGDRNKPVVMCLHGAFGGWDQSILMGKNLLKEGFSLLAISRPGYLGSKSTFSGVISNEEQAAAIVEVLDALKLPKVAVIGFSAGGPVAFQLANLFPNRVSALVLQSIGAHKRDAWLYLFLAGLITYEQLTGDKETLDFMTYLLDLSAIDDFYSITKQILAKDNDLPPRSLEKRINHVVDTPKQAKFLKQFIFSLSPLSPRLDGIVNDVLLAAAGNWPEDPNFYRHLTNPTLIVQGIHDTNGNLETAEYVQSQLANSKLLKVKGCGHFIWLGRFTQNWEKKVVTFLKSKAT